MECSSVLHRLASHNPDLGRLIDEGYDVDLINGYLVVYGVPYLNGAGALQHGDLISKLDLIDEVRIGPPSDHQVFFRGGEPHQLDGQRVRLAGGPNQLVVADGLVADRSFSNKPPAGYASVYEKIDTYISYISAPAIAAFPGTTPKRAAEQGVTGFVSPLAIPDTLSARGGFVDLSRKLLDKRIAIVGLGGTGSYILDFVSKTHVREIHLFDFDIVKLHNAFRIPGTISPNDFGQLKVDFLSSRYAQVHKGITPHNLEVNKCHSDLFREFDFVFVAVDRAAARGEIMSMLESVSVHAVDVGMGLFRGNKGLDGFVRTAYVAPNTLTGLVEKAYIPTVDPVDNEYRHHAQIGELNALNAAMAVIAFKQHFGFFDKLTHHQVSLYDIGDGQIARCEVGD